MESTNEKLELSKEFIMEALREFRGLFNKSPSDKDLELYANLLAGSFEYKQVTWALSEFIKQGSAFFPSCGEIFKILTPKSSESKDVGNEIANELISKIIEFGRYKEGLNEALSLEAREILASNRYLFLEILDSDTDQIPSIRAQIRDLVKAKVDTAKAYMQNEKLESIGIKTGLKLVDFKNIAGAITSEANPA